MYWDNGHMDSDWGIAMVLVMGGFWLLIALAIMWAVLASRGHTLGSAGATSTRAEEILAERLAHGDIDPDEYTARLSALNTSRRRT